MRRNPRLFAIAVALALVAAASTVPAGADPAPGPHASPVVDAHAATLSVETLSGPDFDVRGSVHQVFVIQAPAGAQVELRDAGETVVATGATDALGGLLFRHLEAGDGYAATVTHDGESATSPPITVLDDTHPPFSFYESLPPLPAADNGVSAYGYMPTRDGTTLGVQTFLPGPVAGGPYPTVVEYSGYDPSRPVSLSDNPFAFIANMLGYAYVGVNIRGTGCSGGAFDFFEELQSLDGYDMIETVAAQPWSGNIGMIGVSYPGISQLYVAATQPPHLDAIAPMSVLDDIYRGTLYPGGIFNDGFALDWATDRINSNRWPGGAGWVTTRVNQGDVDCAYNVGLRQQNRDLLAQIQANPHYPAPGNPDYPNGADEFTPYYFAPQIEVPTLLTGAWQDEQTGGHFPYLLEQLTGIPDHQLKVHLQNGTHADAVSPDLIMRLAEHLEFYVGERIPAPIHPAVRALAPVLFQEALGIPGLQLPPDRWTGHSDYEQALAEYEAEPKIRVLWESGAAPGQAPGAPVARGESTFSSWPVEHDPTPLFLQPDGLLADAPPALSDSEPRSISSYVSDPSARPRANYSGSSSGIWTANPPYNWTQHVDGKSLLFETDALTEDLTIVGPSSLDLWLRSSAADTDIQVTLTEVYENGDERYVQSGWLRAGQRKLDEARSTDTAPVPTHLEVDDEPLPAGTFTEVRVALFPVGHVFHAGSKLRIAISAPGGDRPLWTFDSISHGETNEIKHSPGFPSRLVLPVVANPLLPEGVPPCPSLRSQPCRPFVPANVATGVSANLTGEGIVTVDWNAVPDPTGLDGYVVSILGGDAIVADAVGTLSEATVTVGADETSVELTDLADGAYAFVVTPLIGGTLGVPSSPSPLLTLAPAPGGPPHSPPGPPPWAGQAGPPEWVPGPPPWARGSGPPEWVPGPPAKAAKAKS